MELNFKLTAAVHSAFSIPFINSLNEQSLKSSVFSWDYHDKTQTHQLSSLLPYLSGQGQEVAVELNVGHDLCQVLIVLHILVKLQEHAMPTQHISHLLLGDSAENRDAEFCL